MTNTSMSLYLGQAGVDASATGTVLGLLSLSAMAFRPFSGWVCDAFSPKKLLFAFTALTGLCLLGYGVTSSLPLFYFLRIAHGVSFAMTTTVTMAFVAEYIPRGRLGEGMGYFALGQSIATAVGPSLALFLVGRGGGARAFFAAACIALVCLALVFKIPESGRPRAIPASVRRRMRVDAFFAKEALLFAFLTVAVTAVNGIEVGYIASYAAQFGLENAGWYFTLSACALFFSRAALGRVTDRFGFRQVYFTATVLLACALFMLGKMTARSAVLILAVVAIVKALCIGAVQPGLQAMCIKSAPPERKGASASTYYIGADLGNGLSSAVDTDFACRLSAVDENGNGFPLLSGIARAKFRNGDKAELLTPGSVCEFTIFLGNISNLLLKGHRIRLDVTSSLYPAHNRNLNTADRIGYGVQTQRARQTIYHDERHPSALRLPSSPTETQSPS